jgi:hypothetical protein
MFPLNQVVLPRLRFAGPLMLIGTWATTTCSVLPTLTHRPFDGTDAAVADVNEVGIKLGPLGWQRDNSQTILIATVVVYNYGYAERWGFVVQGQFETRLSANGPTTAAATGAFLKYVVKPGVLQDQTGLSIASEFGPLPRDKWGSGRGVQLGWFVSQRWE